MKKQNCRRIERLMLVLVSCVMIAVALLNLLHPATAQAEQTALATGTDVQPTTEPTAEPTPTAVPTQQKAKKAAPLSGERSNAALAGTNKSAKIQSRRKLRKGNKSQAKRQRR